MKVNLLALETSTNICDVSLITTIQDQINIYNNSNDTTAKHAEFLFELIETTLESADIDRNQIDAVVFGQGPGGFTGLRVACGVAQGISFALGVPVVAVSSLTTIAMQAHNDITSITGNKYCHIVIQDARMGEIYVAAYLAVKTGADNDKDFEKMHNIQISQLQTPMLIDMKDLNAWIQSFLPSIDSDLPVLVSGDALSLNENIKDDLQKLSKQIVIGRPLRANSNALAMLGLQLYKQGQTLKPEDAAPLYVRDKVAFTIAERKAGASGNPSANDQLK